MSFALVEIHTKICFQHQNIKSFVPNTEKGFMLKRKFIIITNSFLHLQIWIHLLCRQTDPKNASSTAKFVNRWRKFARSFYIFSRVLNNTFFLRRINRFCGFIWHQTFFLVLIFILTRVRTFTVYALRSFMSNLHFICIAYSLNFERVFQFFRYQFLTQKQRLWKWELQSSFWWLSQLLSGNISKFFSAL